jgi:hypothetical protein
MSIRDRFRKTPTPVLNSEPSLLVTTPTNGHHDEYQELKRRLHRDLIGKLNLASLDGWRASPDGS